MEEIINLKNVGLREKETKTYLDLLKHKESQTGGICNRTKIPSSHIYQILKILLDKGLVSYKIVNGIKIYRATDPENLAHLFDEKERKIKEEKNKLLDSIKKLKNIEEIERLSDFQYYSGIRGIKSLFTKIMNSWEKGDEYYIASAPKGAFEKMEAFFIEVLFKKKNKDKVKLKILVNMNSKEYGEKRKKQPLTKVKYLNLDTNTEYGVLNDYFFLVNYSENPYGLLIKDKNFANTYKTFFKLLWKSAKS